MRYVPAPGLRLRDPRNAQPIGDDGVDVGPHDFDLNRMVDQGDLVAPAETAAPPAPSAPAATAE